MEYNIELPEIRRLEQNEHDHSLVVDFFAQMGEESAMFFNGGHGNENRTLAFCNGTLGDHIF